VITTEHVNCTAIWTIKALQFTLSRSFLEVIREPVIAQPALI